MATNTSIEWADKTWSPIIGCDRVSPGCDSCYAISTARIRESNPHPAIAAAFAGTTQRTDAGIDWSGRINLLNDRLTEPLRWKKPRKVFVNSLSDLFHKNVPDEFIAKVFAVMALTPQHTYQVLTKRHARMRSILSDVCRCGNGHTPGVHFRSAMAWAASRANPDRIPGLPDDAEQRVWNTPWPLPGVWLGVSVENQHWANVRVPALIATPAAIRWISAEPLLGPVDLYGDLRNDVYRCPCGAWERDGNVHTLCADCGKPWRHKPGDARIDWVVAGGESGPKARPMHPDWARSLREQCATAAVPFLFKQHGTWSPNQPDRGGDPKRDVALLNDGTVHQPGHLPARPELEGKQMVPMYRVGKKAAGRELDGRTHDQFPAPA
ncbi:phage Gp37/Gp68 family protein [Streptomyces tibetensis]|uniref:Phage Gp37/Gp68 family protein n=1 Tax=Streptomyces tibetensis TaxID=2382123 RepID=A0ABW6N8H1_9ACTN